MPTRIHLFLALTLTATADPLHKQIDALVKISSGDAALAPLSTDAEFLRRAYLDISGDIPPAEIVRAFLSDNDPNKRTELIDRLLAAPTYAPHMADQFSIILMERRGENEHWRQWLESSFAKNKPWDQMAREILRADYRDEPNRGAAFFYSKRLEKYGANPTDFPGLTRDVGRLFLGIDLQCAECHNHRSIDTYKQLDFQGLHAAFLNLKLIGSDPPTIEEQATETPLEFASVFNQRKKTTGPKIPGLEPISVPTFDKEIAYEVAPDKKSKTLGIPKFSPLAEFAAHMPESPTFARNLANRLWFLMVGRGIVEPLDLFHPDNPPTHPQLLTLLGTTFAKNSYDIKSLLREIALTDTYQRSGQLPENGVPRSDQKFTVAVERRLSAEQLFRMTLTATGNSKESLGAEKFESLQKKFLASFASEAKEPELEWIASLKGALLFLNDEEFAGVFSPRADELTAIKDDAQVAETLYLKFYSRLPDDDERKDIAAYLNENKSTRHEAITDLIWAMLTSTEFATNH